MLPVLFSARLANLTGPERRIAASPRLHAILLVMHYSPLRLRDYQDRGETLELEALRFLTFSGGRQASFKPEHHLSWEDS